MSKTTNRLVAGALPGALLFTALVGNPAKAQTQPAASNRPDATLKQQTVLDPNFPLGEGRRRITFKGKPDTLVWRNDDGRPVYLTLKVGIAQLFYLGFKGGKSVLLAGGQTCVYDGASIEAVPLSMDKETTTGLQQPGQQAHVAVNAPAAQPSNGEVKDPNFSTDTGMNSLLRWTLNYNRPLITLMPSQHQGGYYGFLDGISYIRDEMTMKYYGYNGKTLQPAARLPPNLHQPHGQLAEVAASNPSSPQTPTKPATPQAKQSVSLAPGKDQIAALIAQLLKTGTTGQNPLAPGGSPPKDIHGKVTSLTNGFLTITTDNGATLRYEVKRANNSGPVAGTAGQWMGFDKTHPDSIMSLTVADDGTVAGTPIPPFMTDALKQAYHFGGAPQN